MTHALRRSLGFTGPRRHLATDLEGRIVERTAALDAAARHYRALVPHSSECILVVNADFSIRYASESTGEVLGHAADELAGQSLDALGAGAASALRAALAHAGARPGEASRAEWSLIDTKRRNRRAESTITSLLDDDAAGGFVLTTRDVSDQAFHDPLTGLPNRALLRDRAAQAFARSLRTHSLIAVIVIDLDAFKWVNDTHGHEPADGLLRAIGARLETEARPTDTVSRFGGDEFVVLLDSVESEEYARVVAQRLCNAIRAPLTLDGVEHHITGSVGVAVRSAHAGDFDGLCADADLALYAVKTAGKNAVEIFDPALHERARDRIALAGELSGAIERGEVRVFYQPAWDVGGERLVGFEALVRWQHPTRGLLLPNVFIPLAEKSGLIVALGRLVLDDALAHLSACNELLPEPLTMAINVSAMQLAAPTFVADVREAIARAGIDPALLALEITEAMLVAGADAAIAVLRRLKDLGVRIAIDDFGVGYASLSNLERMPIDVLKVDRSFVMSATGSARASELLKTIQQIGENLSLVTVAEGIETRDQLATVKQLGFKLAQGYLLGLPLPAEESEELAANPSPARKPRSYSDFAGASRS